MYYVSEKDGDWYSVKPGIPGDHVFRTFDNLFEAQEYGRMVKERVRNEAGIQKKLEESIENANRSYESNVTSTSSCNINYNRPAKMHWIYFLLIGWWLGLTLACLIVPLFFRGLVKKSFGYW